jgi:hypothetical protein
LPLSFGQAKERGEWASKESGVKGAKERGEWVSKESGVKRSKRKRGMGKQSKWSKKKQKKGEIWAGRKRESLASYLYLTKIMLPISKGQSEAKSH